MVEVKLWQRIIGLLLVLMTALFLVIWAWNAAFRITVLAPDRLRAILNDNQIYAEIIPQALPFLIDSVNPEIPLPPMSEVVEIIGDEAWREVTNTLLPPDWLKAEVKRAASAFLHLIQGNINILDESLNLEPLVNRLQGEPAEQAAALILDAAPACTARQQAIIQAVVAGETDEPLPICNPTTSQSRELSIGVITGTLNVIGDVFEERVITYRELFGLQNPEDVEVILLLFEGYNRLSLGLLLGAGALLSLIVVFTVRSLKSFGRWIGATHIVAAITAVIPLLLLSLALVNMFSQALNVSNEAERIRVSLVVNTLQSGFTSFSSIVLMFAGVSMIIGIILLVVAMFAPGRSPMITTGAVLMTPDGQVVQLTDSQAAEGGIPTPKLERQE